MFPIKDLKTHIQEKEDGGKKLIGPRRCFNGLVENGSVEGIYAMIVPQIPDDIVRCASQIVGNSVVVGTDKGCVYRLKDGEWKNVVCFKGNPKSPKENNKSVVHMRGSIVMLSSYESSERVMIDLSDPTKDQIIKTKNMAMINASCEYTVNDQQCILVAGPDEAVRHKVIPFGYLYLSNGREFEVCSYNAEEQLDGVYCEFLVPYNGPDTPYFKKGEVYGQFRAWTRLISESYGFVHRVKPFADVRWETRWKIDQKPLVFDFVTGKPQMVIVNGDGSVCLMCLTENTVLMRWTGLKLGSTMPSIDCSGHHAFISNTYNGDNWLLTVQAYDDKTTSDFEADASKIDNACMHYCSKTLDSESLVFLLSL